MIFTLNVESYEAARKHICMKLINFEKNRKYLYFVPHICKEDLAIIFFSYATLNHGTDRDLNRREPVLQLPLVDECMMPVINNDLMSSWGVTEQQLMEDALANTPVLLPPRFESIEHILGMSSTEMESHLMVLTNERCVNGAAAMLYPGLLDLIADKMEDDFYIIPSSVHEVLLFPASEIGEADTLKRYVREINENEVIEKEILSNTIYLYNRDSGMFTMV